MLDLKMSFPVFKHIFILILLLSALSVLGAREVEITVEDADIEMPLEGAIIHSWDGIQYVCDEEGKAIVTVPDDRQVVLQISYPGYETGRLVIPPRGDSFSLGLRLGGAIVSRELVIEASRPGQSETRPGRSVAVSGEILERSSRIGVVEDVMSSIKLLPGVGYTGMFNAMPSIRGGDPGDLMSVFDGFYISNPYHWGGGFSIFDPHMVWSAQLSHGVFSSRHGHSISGLLEISSKRASPNHAELELGISTSAVNLNAAFPIKSQGGLMLMGKATYWDPFIWFVQGLSNRIDNERLDMVNAITTAPYIRSSAASFFYRINPDLEFFANAFIGADGAGADYKNEEIGTNLIVEYSQNAKFNWDNLQTFFIGGLLFNPRPSMVLRTSMGAGYEEAKLRASMEYDFLRVWSGSSLQYQLFGEHLDSYVIAKIASANVQGRVDFDWDLGGGFLFAAGFQELISQRIRGYEGRFYIETRAPNEHPTFGTYYISSPFQGALPEVKNLRFNSSAYVLGEYSNARSGFGAELGLRADHIYFSGQDYNIQTQPVLNPRLNLDYNVFRNRSYVESLDLTLGTGLFSSLDNSWTSFDPGENISDYDLRPNRSWTSVLGFKLDLFGGWTFGLEAYYKYVFNRSYQYLIQEEITRGTQSQSFYDGRGSVWGLDVMIQKFESRYWDGWLSYTFTYARYNEPWRPNANNSAVERSELWYYPYFHRFHNANLVLNFRPFRNFQIYTRLGFASGRPKPALGEIHERTVLVLDNMGNPMQPYSYIRKFNRESRYDDNSRTTWSIPWDLKFSYSIFNPRNRVLTEIYLAAENLASLFYVAQANTSFNQYTGKEETGSDSANYELPVPMVSLGVRWSY